MLVYSWQLAIAVVLLMIPMLLVVWLAAGPARAAFDRCGRGSDEMLSEVSETVMGAAVVRAYGLEDADDRRVERAIGERYDAADRGALPRGDALPDRRRSSTRSPCR